MVERQLRARGIADERVLTAFERVPRHRFVPPDRRWAAYEDEPLPIGLGQTISQPYMVARMTELLELTKVSRVLEVGTGSGYQAAILGELAGEVWSIERHEALARMAGAILEELGAANVHVVVGDGSLGLPERAPYDGIVVTAAAPFIPPALRSQLADGGLLVIPVGDTWNQWLTVLRRAGDTFREANVLGCRFVPLIGEEGYHDG
jgi:protein-L-isoaspartate(D-aspartate) O-methyltransferase